MYGSEHEIRRLLLFLVERITREDEKYCEPTNQSFVTNGILYKLKNTSINSVWLPYSSDGLQVCNEDHLKYCTDSDRYDDYMNKVTNPNSVHASHNLDFNLKQFLAKTHSKALQKYAKFKLMHAKPFIESNQLLPNSARDILKWNSIYWNSNQFEYDTESLETFGKPINLIQTKSISLTSEEFLVEPDSTSSEKPISNVKSEVQKNESVSNNISKEELYSNKINTLQSQLDSCNALCEELARNEEELVLCETDYQNKIKLYEAVYKTKDELEQASNVLQTQIKEIATTWEEIERGIVAEIEAKQAESLSKNGLFNEKIRQINDLKNSITDKTKEIEFKETRNQELRSKVPKHWQPSRSSYTKRIIEIINNIKKHNDETKKVLLETKSLQKDINMLNGKLERSFAVSEEVMFKDAKANEWNRKCYKLLVTLKTTFDQLLEAVFVIGSHLRNIRQLEETVKQGFYFCKYSFLFILSD